MSRFRYTLQPALDDALACERSGLATLVRARRAVFDEETALAALCEQAVAVRADLACERSGRASTYVEAGLRLLALDAARRERGERLRRACEIATEARFDVARLSARRLAIESHRGRLLERWLAAEAAREANDYDEANAARPMLVRHSAALR